MSGVDRRTDRCPDCGWVESFCQCDEDDYDVPDDYDCSWCGGEGEFWGNELPGYDPGWHLPDQLYPCPACKGTGNRRDQVLF